MMTTTNNNMNMAHEVEGPDPVRWPGENYELLTDTPGFVLPERAAKILTIADGSGVPWKVNRPERSNVEEIHTLEKEGFPLEIRARIAGSGAHPDADYVQYVLEFKYLLGAQNEGRYGKLEVTRGTLDEVAAVASKMQPLIADRFEAYCMFKRDHPIVKDLVGVEEIIRMGRC